MKVFVNTFLLLVLSLSLCGQVKDKDEARSKPLLPANQVSEAMSGFSSPVDFSSTHAGYDFLAKTRLTTYEIDPITKERVLDKSGKPQVKKYGYYKACEPDAWAYHPGWDMNKAGVQGDKGEPVRAAADGVVIFLGKYSSISPRDSVKTQVKYIDKSTKKEVVIDIKTLLDGVETRQRKISGDGWAAIALQHNYKGVAYVTVYGHANHVPTSIKLGDFVKKGTVIALIDQIDADSPHLHFEIRNTSHPNPTNGQYFCYVPKTVDGKKQATLQNLENVKSWYEDPDPSHEFMKSLGPYTKGDGHYVEPKTVASSTSSSTGSVASSSTEVRPRVKREGVIAQGQSTVNTPQSKVQLPNQSAVEETPLQKLARGGYGNYACANITVNKVMNKPDFQGEINPKDLSYTRYADGTLYDVHLKTAASYTMSVYHWCTENINIKRKLLQMDEFDIKSCAPLWEGIFHSGSAHKKQ